ncbi:sodium channel protein Nach-like [Thrips palmi]|uniref:Sodium channel protein Nach-like n=1 Tax=Thrips palmi TaxID=161013 RepID=A0A6P9A0B6_THRPL|nr:sodium channel protein Nach-like [Thrips palmi]
MSSKMVTSPSQGRHTAARHHEHHALADRGSSKSKDSDWGRDGRDDQGSARTLSARSDDSLLPQKSMISRVGLYVREFFEQSTLHGLRYMILDKGNYFDVALWTVALVASVTGAILLIGGSWRRFQDNPTVVQLEKDFRLWNTSFPSATMCYDRRLDELRVQDQIAELWGARDNDTDDYRRYYKFVEAVANASFWSLDVFKEFKGDKELNAVNMLDLADKVNLKVFFRATVFDTSPTINFTETLTEMGICYSYSAVTARYLPVRRNTPFEDFKPPQCNFLNSLCYARVEDLQGPVKYYVHSPYEIPDSASKPFTVHSRQERDTTVRFLETIADEQLRTLTRRQRRCQFFDEGVKPYPVYSYNLCMMSCRRKLCLRYCGCAPYFYGDRGDGVKMCDVDGLACLAQHADKLVALREEDPEAQCKCYHSCEEIRYTTDRNFERSWSYPVPDNIRFRWAIELYSKTRVKRSIIFTFSDLLVSFGGTAALFLGCSLITFVELIYFFTLRLLCSVAQARKRRLT